MVPLDELDRRLVHALQIDGRASFRRIGGALGVPERMVARRYSRLRSRLTLRVIGTTNPHRLGQLEWFVRIRTTSRSVDAVAASLAARADTSWVSVLTGGTEVTGILRAAAPTGGGPTPVLTRLARSPQVQDVTAQCLLAPVAGVGGWLGRVGFLSGPELAALAPATTPAAEPSSAPLTLTDRDTALLRELTKDARATVAHLSRATGVSESTTRRRITELVEQGVLRFEIDIDAHLYGRPLEVICWLDVEPRGLDEVTQALSTHSQVAFASTTTGDTAIVAILELTDTRELHDYLRQALGTLSTIRHAETALVERRVKRAGAVLPVTGAN